MSLYILHSDIINIIFIHISDLNFYQDKIKYCAAHGVKYSIKLGSWNEVNNMFRASFSILTNFTLPKHGI